MGEDNSEKIYQLRLLQRLRIVTGIHNFLVVLLSLFNLVLSAGVLYLLYLGGGFVVSLVPAKVWVIAAGGLVLVDLFYNLSHQFKSGGQEKARSITLALLGGVAIFLALVVLNFFLVLRKFVWLGEEKQVYASEALQFLYQQKQPENLGHLAKEIWERKKKWEEGLPAERALEFAKKREKKGTEKLVFELEEGKTAVMELDMAMMDEWKKITGALRGLAKLLYIEELVNEESKDALPFYKLTERGEEFMIET